MKSRHRSDSALNNQVIRDNDSTSSLESSKSSCSNSFLSGSLDSESSCDERDPIIYNPRISGGCIISERPIFLKNSLLCVINNRKCTLYSSHDAKRLCDTRLSPEMIIGSRSFTYENDYEILLCASSNGSVLVYHVPEDINKTAFYDKEINKRRLDLVVELRVVCKNLLALEVNRETGEIVCVILTNQLKTELIRFSLNYNNILFDDNFGVTDLDDVIYIDSPEDVKPLVTNGHVKDVEKKNKEPIKEYKKLLSLETNLEVFEVDPLFKRAALGINKSCLIVDLKTQDGYYFESDNLITCIAFDNRGFMALGDSSGQIIIISPLEKTCFVNANYISTVSLPVLGFKVDCSNTNISNLSNNLYVSSKINNKDDTKLISDQYTLGRVETKRLHWHSHGVNCLRYNENNHNMLVSGGEEGVLVVWDLANHSKKFVTRLGAPIFHVAVAPDQTLLASLQNNSIFLIDPTSLAIRAKVSSIIIDFPLCDGCLENRRIIDYYPSNWIKGLFSPPGDKSSNEVTANVGMGINSIVVSNMNKLQIYDYIRDCESKLIDITNVNYVSRQDEDFGQHYHISNLCVSQDCKYIVVLQSRSVKIGTEEEHVLDENANKYILKFYHFVPVKNDDYVLNTNINNPHTKRVTSIKELVRKNKFLTSSLDGNFNLYSLVQLSDNKSPVNQTKPPVSPSSSPVHLREAWIIDHVFDFKNLPIHSLSVNENDLMLFKHDGAMSLWKYSESHENRISLVKPMPLNNAQDVFYIEFVNNESVLMCTRKQIYTYNLKDDTKNTVLESGDSEEVNSAVFKYDLLVVNVRRYVQSVNYMNYIEIYNLNNMMKIHSKAVSGVNTSFDFKLLPYPTHSIATHIKRRHREHLHSPLFKRNLSYYHLLVINSSTHDLEVVTIIRDDDNYSILDEFEATIRCRRITKRDIRLNYLGAVIRSMLDRGRERRRKSKRRFSLCAEYYKQSSYRCKRIDVGMLSELYNSSDKFPRPNVLLDRIINILV